MNSLDLFNNPQKSYIIYQSILISIGYILIYILSLFLKFNIIGVMIGYFTGCLAITIGFYLIIFSADKVLSNANDEKHAKTISLMYVILRYVIYLLICGISIKIFDANILAIIIGMFSLKIIIFIDSIIQKNGGEG